MNACLSVNTTTCPVLVGMEKQISHQVVVRPDPKQLSKVSEGHRGVGFKPKVRVVVGWCEVAAFAVWKHEERER